MNDFIMAVLIWSGAGAYIYAVFVLLLFEGLITPYKSGWDKVVDFVAGPAIWLTRLILWLRTEYIRRYRNEWKD